MLDCGLDPKTADMVYIRGNCGEGNLYSMSVFEDPACVLAQDYNLPAWSLSALLTIMPAYIHAENDTYRLTMRRWIDPERGYPEFEVCYENLDGDMVASEEHVTPMIAVENLAVWLLRTQLMPHP